MIILHVIIIYTNIVYDYTDLSNIEIRISHTRSFQASQNLKHYHYLASLPK